MNLPSLFDSLSTRFGLLKLKMKIENSVNDFGLQLTLENTAIQILNIVYEYDLVNANQIEHNYPAVDGLDKTNQIALQITSTFNKTKILSTIKKYLNNDIHKTYPYLKFFFLKDIKTLNKETQNEVSELLKNEHVDFNLKESFIDYETIYQKLYYEQDVFKAQRVIEVIDKVLGTLPIGKTSSFASIGVSFEDDEINNVEVLLDNLLKQGINVYVTSEKIYKLLSNHRAFEYLILVNEKSNIKHISHFLIILSNKYIQNNLSHGVSCMLLNTLLSENHKSKTLAFNPYITNLKSIKNKRFLLHKNLDTNLKALQGFAEDVVNSFLASTVNELTVNPENIKESLISIRKGFSHKILEENNQQKTILFYINSMDVEIIYVVLKNKFSNADIINHIKSLSKTYTLNNINLLVPQNPDHKTRRVLHTFRERLQLQNVYYIDEFLFEETLKDISQLPILGIDDFVKPIIKQNGSIIHLSDILHWIVEERNPSIGIIKAPGGIGKTTLVEKIHDELINKENEHKYLVLFIEANDFIKHFSNVDFTNEKEYDLYTIFKKCHNQGHSINELLFYNNYRHGNILMIIDGVDEIVSTITSFNLDAFLTKLSQFGDKIGKGKILLTSRDLYVKDIQSFLNKINGNGNAINIYELMPFNKALAKKYFSLNNISERKSNRGISLLEEFVLEKDRDNEYVYPPFVLDIVLDYMDTEDGANDSDDMFNSKYLVHNHRLDFIVQQTFNRESIKKSNYGYDLGIDAQVAFFSLMALEKRGMLQEQEILEVINQIGFISNSEKIAESLKDHPFLRMQGDYYQFIYKFLVSEFSITGIFNLFKNQDFIKLNDHVIRVLALDCNYNSIIAKGLLAKLRLDAYFNEKKVVSVIKKLIKSILGSSETLKLFDKKAISNLFLIIHEYYNDKNDTSEKIKTIIKDIFGQDNSTFISNFYLYDIPDNLNMILDFKGLYFNKSEVVNYSNFIFCEFDAITSFESSCTIKNINLQSISLFDRIEDLSIIEENFDNVKGDNTLHKVLRLRELGEMGIEKELRRYLKAFYTGKTLRETITFGILRSSYNNKNLEHKITQEMQEANIFVSVTDNDLTLNTKLKSKINKFVYQGRSFLEIKKVFRNIANKL